MSKIDDLIVKLCPDGVCVKNLNEIAEVGTGSRNGNEGIENGIYPLYVRSKFIKSIDSYDFDEEAIIIPGEGGIGEIFHYVNGKYALHQRAYRIHLTSSEILNKFVFYFMMTHFKSFINKVAVNATVSSIRKPMIEKFPISIPPLAIQEKIVEILDQFTQLETELEMELEARKAQYQFYRNQLLAFENKEVEVKSLGEICLKTSNIKWKENIGEEYHYIDLSAVNRNNNKIEELQTITSENAPSRAQQIVNTNDIIFGTTRPTLKRYALLTEDLNNQICSTGFCVLRADESIILPKFLFFILTTDSFLNFVENNQEGAGYPSISNTKVKNFSFPVPKLAEQERIVKILDQFDDLVNNISSGLPAEIKARRQQYEYYRAKLLTFKVRENH